MAENVSYLDMSDDELLSCVRKSLDFDYGDYQEYQSELSHRLKTYGAEFVNIYGSDEAYSFAMSLGEHCALYLHTLVRYLCGKQGVVFEGLPISRYSPEPMKFLLLSEGASLVYEAVEDISLVREDLLASLPEFLAVGLMVFNETLYGAV